MSYLNHIKNYIENSETCKKRRSVLKEKITNIIISSVDDNEIISQLPFINNLWAEGIAFFVYRQHKSRNNTLPDIEFKSINKLASLFDITDISIYDNAEDFILAIKCYYYVLSELGIIGFFDIYDKNQFLDTFNIIKAHINPEI